MFVYGTYTAQTKTIQLQKKQNKQNKQNKPTTNLLLVFAIQRYLKKITMWSVERLWIIIINIIIQTLAGEKHE